MNNLSHFPIVHNTPDTPTEHHVVKRILAGLLAATFMVGAQAANVAPTVAMTAPAANATFIGPASMTLSASAADSDGTITKVVFYRGATLIGTVTTAPYNFNWNNVAAGTYSITSKATDNLGAVTTSAPLTVTVNPNVLPSVALTAPAAGANFIAPATVAMSATASDSDGSIAKVAYYRDATLIGSSTTAPYLVNWTNAPAGTYSVTARATDDKGGVTTSAAVPVLVKVNELPSVAITTPASNATFAAPGFVPLKASASDTDGTISKVVYFNGATQLGTTTLAPYAYSWSNVAVGTYNVTAKAYDNKGGITTSAPVTVVVNANVPPTAVLTGPADNATFVAPGTITLSASAADSDGTVTKVVFYRGGTTTLGTVTTAPYNFSWSNVAAGTYTITAKSTDDKGAVTTSAPITVTVVPNVVPTVSVTAPVNNATYYAPATVTLTASAADSDGTVSKVDFYRATTLIGTATSAPYTVTWSNAAAGTYSVTAKATDDKNGTKTSTAITVKVLAAPVPTVAIASPANNASYFAPAQVTLTSTAAVSGDSISKVEYYIGGALVGTATAPPYTATVNNLAAGNYSVSAKAIGVLGGSATSAAINLVVNTNAAPAVSLALDSVTASAPATVTLTATASDSDGSISKVEFYNGETLLATRTQAPYAFTWSDVVAGTYSLTARATDDRNLTTQSDARSLTVTAPAPAGGQVYYVLSDQINTAREIINGAGTKVWEADSEPFGANPPNENPAGLGQFTYNLRFPGQYADKETGLHYNYYRDYDPQTGRYVQSDPIGLGGGINTYGYVHANPVSFTDPTGELVPAVVAGGIWAYRAYRVYRVADAIAKAARNDPKASRPATGEPGSTHWPGIRPDGTYGDGRKYGPDGLPEIDYDHGHPGHHGGIGDHVHDWEKGERSKDPRPYSPVPRPPTAQPPKDGWCPPEKKS
ncbi:MAG: Ig-like domain-containing protein [Pseudomonadota bacterium]